MYNELFKKKEEMLEVMISVGFSDFTIKKANSCVMQYISYLQANDLSPAADNVCDFAQN